MLRWISFRLLPSLSRKLLREEAVVFPNCRSRCRIVHKSLLALLLRILQRHKCDCKRSKLRMPILPRAYSSLFAHLEFLSSVWTHYVLVLALSKLSCLSLELNWSHLEWKRRSCSLKSALATSAIVWVFITLIWAALIELGVLSPLLYVTRTLCAVCHHSFVLWKFPIP
jgi:hypothetical protein